MKQRIIQVCGYTFLILGIGILYAIFVQATHIAIPCMFYTITGLRCPGCGITHMCISILHGNFRQAMQYNYMIFFLLPLLILITGDYILRYIRTGQWKILRWQSYAFYIMIICLVLFAVVRNIYGF